MGLSGSVVPLRVLEGRVYGCCRGLGPGPGQQRGGAGGRHGDLEHLFTPNQSQEGPQAVQGRLGAPLSGQQVRLQVQAFLLAGRESERRGSEFHSAGGHLTGPLS